MQKCIFDVKSSYRPIFGDGNRENKSDCGRLNNGIKGFIEVNAGLLVETFGNEPSFKTLYGTITSSLDAIHPLATHYIHMRSGRDE